jgi:CheY-like chemotaxis protein/anti-sigma regulatory factor (Ser/Thr protein kinase)
VPADQQPRAIETIERNTRAQVHLIEDILDFSRIVAGRLRLATAPVDLVGVVEAAIDTVRPAAEARGVRVLASLDRGDAARLQPVAWNLLSNAVKFTPRGGRVLVRLAREGSHVELAVTDTGQGIDPRFLPRVFDRFAQQETSAARRQGGLGLGLAIARHLVELHGGTIRAESDGEGRGATFVVRLPLAPPAPAATPPTALPAARPSLPGAPGLRARRVLVVDDEPDARELIRAILESGGASVATAASAEEAFESLRASPPDVLVSDVGMPREDGYSLIKRVRALSIEQGGRTPAVALTAYARAEDRARALAAGFDHHVTKPVEPQELLLVVADLAPGPARP